MTINGDVTMDEMLPTRRLKESDVNVVDKHVCV